MAKLKVTAAKGRVTPDHRPEELHVPLASLRWTLTRRLLLAIPVGLFFAGLLLDPLDGSDFGTLGSILVGQAAAFALVLTLIWLAGRRRRAAFAVSGGDPNAAGILLFGVLPRRTCHAGRPGSDGGFYSGGGPGSGSGGDCSGGGGGGGDGGGGGGGD
ncbi:hypothetical protein [Pseudarthrobacter sp. MM222]|uniref:hypothetical protein n=1 Tax=Pseudarthrobacter sp. MM222 TaxID=3018929 RepID=UPI002220EE47|nr:hypothetical protein [Pseudarthrobacter sp. MM222]CAI3803525.1 hypothetical protein NKCBBBOE_03370 [Pseudarthrobacter sp. MM222]